MAKFIIYRNNGLNNSPVAPTGYKFLGYDSDNLSEKTDNIISPIGSGGSGGSEIENLRKDLDNTNKRLEILEEMIKSVADTKSS